MLQPYCSHKRHNSGNTKNKPIFVVMLTTAYGLVLIQIGRGQICTPAEHMSPEGEVFVRATLRSGLGLIQFRAESWGLPVVVASLPRISWFEPKQMQKFVEKDQHGVKRIL